MFYNTNAWGLYDMVGNLWEWSTADAEPMISGGSCLSPLKYIHFASEADYQITSTVKAAREIGFRVMVAAK